MHVEHQINPAKHTASFCLYALPENADVEIVSPPRLKTPLQFIRAKIQIDDTSSHAILTPNKGIVN
jgi:hypothetical protein